LQECTLVHIATLFELGKSEELFKFAHRIIDTTPDDCLGWYAVACYYYAIGNLATARSFFGEGTATGWIMSRDGCR
jgi:anaphase-promoting complex subunit 6